MIYRVRLSASVMRQLLRLPRHVASKLKGWLEAVESDGLEVVRRIPGYHDEALAGKRRGQRSIRLNRSYRAIYRVALDGEGEVALVEEVTKHAY